MTIDNKWLLEEDEITSSIPTKDFLAGLDVGITLQNADGVFVGCNQFAAELLGHPKEVIVGRTLHDVPWTIEAEDGTEVKVKDLPSTRARVTRNAQPSMTLAISSEGSKPRWISVRSYPIILDGVLKGVLSSFDDLTIGRDQFQSLVMMSVISKLLMAATDEETFLSDVCKAFVESGGYALVKIDVAIDDPRKSVRTLCASGVVDYGFEGMASWSEEKMNGRGPIGTALRTQTTQVVNSLASDAVFAPWRERAVQFGLGAVVTIPFSFGDSRAVLSIYEHHAHSFSEGKLQMLEVMAKDIEFALKRLESIVGTRMALAGTITALSRMTASRDPYTAGHQLRVGSLGARIATKLNLDPSMILLIQQSGELHDVGKIAIPTEILSRPGRFSTLEYDMVKRHTLIGGDILSRALLPWPIAEVAMQHHERLDGSGYPYGLQGDQIGRPARIIAVADVVEAMTQHRPYRPALGLDAALGEVSQGAGTKYDADVVSACLEVFADGYEFESDLGSLWD